MVPTIGVLETLPGYEDSSGHIIVMTDSSCMDSASASLSKCYGLMDRFVKLAAQKTSIDPILMNSDYRLPQDFRTNERPKIQKYEDVDFRKLILYKQSHLNSWNQKCFVKPQYAIDTSYLAFEH